MADITTQLQQATSTPEDAAKIIGDANRLNVGPDEYKDSQPYMQSEADLLKLYPTVTRGVSEYSKQSSQHASLIKNNTFELSQVENTFSSAIDKINGNDLTRKIINLKIKQSKDPNNFTPEEKLDLFTAQDEQETRNKFRVQKEGKHEKLINQFYETQKETDTFKSMFAAYGGGLFTGIANISQVPILANDIYYYPENLGRSFLGLPELKAPETLTKNPVYQKFTAMAKDFNAMAPELNKDISDSIADGDFIEAGRIAAIKVANNIPNLTLTVLSSLLGGPAGGAAFAGVTSASQSNIENIEKGFEPSQALPNAVIKGSFEAIMEKVGTLSMFKRLESSLTFSFGKDSAGKVIYNMFRSILGGGASEFAEEGLTSGAQDLTDYVSGVNPDALTGIGKRALESGIVGGVIGAGLVAPAAAIKAKSNIYYDKQIRDTQTKAVDLLNFDSDVQNALEIFKETDMSKHSKEEQQNFLKGIFKGLNFDSVYINIENLREKITTPEKAEAVRNIIDPTGETNSKLNVPVKVPAHQFFPLIFEFPELAQEYSLSPEEASVRQSVEFLQAVEKAQQDKKAVLDKLGAPEQTPEDISMINQALNPEQPSAVYPSNDVYGEAEYLDDSGPRKAMEGIVSDKEIDKILTDQNKAKQQVVDHINQSAELEMNQVLDVQMMNAMEAEREAQFQRLEDNPNVLVVDRFANTQSLPNDSVLQSVQGFEALHSTPGFSPLAIDPETLPPELKALKKDPRLKKSKVFVKGGLNVYDTVALLGFETPEQMFEVLAQTPSREEIAEQRAEARRSDIEAESRDQIGLNEAGITKAYQARLANALETMKIMKDKFWSSTVKGFKGIALTPPTPKALMYEARQAIIKTKIKDLNVNQFKVGERKSERVAWDAITKNQVEKAYTNQKAVAQNIALTMQTQLAIAKVNREIRFARKFSKPSVIQELKDAGPLYYEAAQEMLNAFNFGTKNDTAEKASFVKWAEKVASEGNGDFKIPERMLDQRESFKEMTVEQVTAVGQALRGILHTARYKNKLFKKFENIKSLQTIENFGNMVEKHASEVFDYKVDKSKTYQDSSVNGTDEAAEYLLGMKNYLERSQHILVKLDNNKANGFFNTVFYRPLVEASNAKKVLIKETQAHLDKLINEFGKEQWDNLASEFITVPEFKDVTSFKDGRVSKADLLSMELNFGNEGNIAELEKFGVDRNTIRKVLDRELTDRHTALVQNIWNMYTSFQPKMDELQRRTKGEATEWVEAKPFTARGKEYPGGYYPIARLSDKLKIEARKALGVGEMNSLDKFKLNYYGDAMTEQGHLKARTGNDDFINLNLNTIGYSLNQIIHDLTHREIIADGVKLLSDKKIREAMANVIGKEGYSNIVGTYISTAQEVENDSYGENGLLKLTNRLGAGMQVVALGGNITSIAIQPASILLALDKMGKVASTPVFAKIVGQMLSSPGLILSFVELAEQINPGIAAFTEDVQKNSSSNLNDLIPTEKNKLDPIIKYRDMVMNGSFKALATVDKINKVLVTLTAYQLALQGKVKGLEHLKGDVKESMVYASNISELTQTHNDIRNLSPIQKNKYMKQYVYFFNDLNNLFNNSIGASREVRSQFKKGNHWQSGVAFTGFFMTLTMLKLFEQFIRGAALPGDDDDKTVMNQWTTFLTQDVPGNLISTVPIIRDMTFAAGKSWQKRKVVEMPLTNALSDLTTGAMGVKHYLEFIGENEDIPAKEREAIWKSAGILLKLPTGQIYKHFVREIPDKEFLKKGPLDRLSEAAQKIYNSAHIPESFKKDVAKIEGGLNPFAVKIEKEDYSVLKEMISKSNPTAYNEDTGAAGIYQFTEDTWNRIMKEAPELALTENGRVMQKTEQQQKAFEYESKANGEILRAAGYEANVETLYGSHILGGFKMVQILAADDSTKVDTLVSSKLLDQYKIPKEYKVKDFKDWLIFENAKANRRLTNDSNK